MRADFCRQFFGSQDELGTFWSDASESAGWVCSFVFVTLRTYVPVVVCAPRLSHRDIPVVAGKRFRYRTNLPVMGHTFFLDGFMSSLWASAQQTHYHTLGRRTSGTQWAGSRLIHLIWQMSWDLWMHRATTHQRKETVDDMQLPGLHAALNTSINNAHTTYHSIPNPSLAQWFSYPTSRRIIRLENQMA